MLLFHRDNTVVNPLPWVYIIHHAKLYVFMLKSDSVSLSREIKLH